MHSLPDPGKEAASRERAIGLLSDRTGTPLADVRRLFAQEFSRLEFSAKNRSYLSILTVSNVRTMLRRKRRSPVATAVHAPAPWVRPTRFIDELGRLWRERPRTLYRRLVRGYPGEFMRPLDSAIDYFVSRFTNAAHLLKEQLTAEGVTVWVSAGCLKEFARIASVAAARTRQVDEPYLSCLRREIVTRARFIREWTSSGKNFDPTQWGDHVSVARKYALPRPWKVLEAVASVRGHTVAAPTPAQSALNRSDGGQAPRPR